MSEKTSSLNIKGLRDGLLITMQGGEWLPLQQELLARIQEKQAFFQGARLALDVGSLILHVTELSELRDALSEQRVSLWAVISESPTTEKSSQLLGLATRISKPQPSTPVSRVEVRDDTALLVKKTVRSGVRIEYPGSIVILGDVNPGAEIIAGGSVIVWGRLRGVVHAGAEGDHEAVICALDLSPQQLRIASEMVVAPQKNENSLPEIASLKNGRLLAEPWNPA